MQFTSRALVQGVRTCDDAPGSVSRIEKDKSNTYAALKMWAKYYYEDLNAVIFNLPKSPPIG